EEVRALLDPLGVEPNPAAELAELLGQKPLALELLARLLRSGGASVRELLPHLQRELLTRELPDDPAVTGAARAAGALAELVAVALGERGGAVCRLMNALSLLAPATIPLPLLQALSEALIGHQDPTAQLVQRGLAVLDPRGLQVHPLVALAARR